ncbi:hypothetical protein H257_18905, partial [Aphanomyces astaci]
MAPPSTKAPHRKAIGRPVVKNCRRNGPPQHRRHYFSYAKQLHIINWRKQHSMDSALDTFFWGAEGIARSSAFKRVLRWEHNRPHITKMANIPATTTQNICRPAGCATTLSSEYEEQIPQWVCDMRSEGIPVSKFLLQCKALEVAKDLGLTDNRFKESPSWISGFIKQRGEAALAAFSNRIRQLVQTEAIDDIYNADQTGINFEYIPKHAIDRCGANTGWIRCSGHEKDRMTAMLLADNKGTKYPMFLVLKSRAPKVKATVVENLTKRNGFGPVVCPEVEELHERHASRLYGNRISQYYFGYRKDKNMKKILLLWDDFSTHFSDDVVACAESLDVLLEKNPPTFKRVCQPADVAWMKPLKASMRLRWLRPPSRDNLVEWVNEAWEAMPKSTI